MISLPYGVGLGQAYNVRISPDGSTIGLLHAEGTSVYDRKLYTSSVENLVLKSANADNVKDYESPADFEFAGDSSVILRRAKHGRLVLAHLKLQEGEVAKEFTSEGAVQKYFPLQEKNWNALLVTSTSFIDSCLVQIINVPKARIVRTVSSATKHGAKFGLSKKMVSEICYKGADELDIHAFVIKPNDFDEKKTYPWVLMPHGGPVSSHTDSWSTRVGDMHLLRRICLLTSMNSGMQQLGLSRGTSLSAPTSPEVLALVSTLSSVGFSLGPVLLLILI